MKPAKPGTPTLRIPPVSTADVSKGTPKKNAAQKALECKADSASSGHLARQSQLKRLKSQIGHGVENAPAGSPQQCNRCDSDSHSASCCPYFRQPPLNHPDALSRGNISHSSQINEQAILSKLAPGTASGSENSCLIDRYTSSCWLEGRFEGIAPIFDPALPHWTRENQGGRLLGFQFTRRSHPGAHGGGPCKIQTRVHRFEAQLGPQGSYQRW